MRLSAVVRGVPQTAAEGWSCSASSRTLMFVLVWPVTSVARCMTLGRSKTKGVSGTDRVWQWGWSTSVTEVTA